MNLADFESAAMPHLADIYRTACSLTGNASDGQDLAQDVYLQAWKSFHRFELGTNCRAWLYKILFHRMSHFRRKAHRYQTLPEENTLEQTLAAPVPAGDQLTDRQVLAALDRLSPQFREVLLLADVQEFSYKEVAETLEIPIGTVMSRLSRARAQLREDLREVAAGFGIGKKDQSA